MVQLLDQLLFFPKRGDELFDIGLLGQGLVQALHPPFIEPLRMEMPDLHSAARFGPFSQDGLHPKFVQEAFCRSDPKAAPRLEAVGPLQDLVEMGDPRPFVGENEGDRPGGSLLNGRQGQLPDLAYWIVLRISSERAMISRFCSRRGISR